jgi:hypothetical protein
MNTFSKLGLTCGYVLLAVAAVQAHLSPTSGYELSIYSATPATYWAAIVCSLFVAVVVAFAATGVTRGASLVLAVASMYSVATLPLARGYYFYGTADAMTHLGWAKDLLTGRLPVLELYYPGLHSTTLLTSVLSSVSLRYAMLVVVSLFFLAFVAFTFLAVRTLSTSTLDRTLAVFAALLTLPITHLTTHYPNPHPISDAIMLIPLGIYLIARYVTRRDGTGVVTRFGVLFAVYSVATVSYHSMQALHMLVLLGGILGVQLYFRLRSNVFENARASLSRITTHRPMYVQTAFLGALFLVWNLNRQRTRNAVEGFTTEFISLLTGTGEPATYVQSRNQSLSVIGGDLVELFAKMFLPSALFCAVVGLLMIGVFLGRLDDEDSDADTLVEYLCFALAGLLVFDVVLLFAGTASDLFFRTLGAVLAVVTVLAVLAVPRLAGWLTTATDVSLPSPSVRKVGGMVMVGLLLTASVPVVYASPYILQTNGQVTEQEFSGHEIVFEHEAPDTEVAAVRSGPVRFYDAIYGVEEHTERTFRMGQNGVPFKSLDSLQAAFATDHYVTISDSDRQREAGLFRGLRYEAAGFDALDWQPDVHRVTSNGEFRSYLVDKGVSA